MNAAEENRSVQFLLEGLAQLPHLGIVVGTGRKGDQIGVVVLDVANDVIQIEGVVEPFTDVLDACIVAGLLERRGQIGDADALSNRAIKVRPYKLNSHASSCKSTTHTFR